MRDYSKNKFTLITNLDYITVDGKLPVRTHASALLLQEMPAMFGDEGRMDYRVRAFGPDPAWPVFEFLVKSLDYTTEAAATNAVFIGTDDKVKPLGSGVIMRFAEDGPVLQLWASKQELPIDVTKFEGDVITSHVWPALQRKTAEFWDPPAMPVLLHTPVPQVVNAIRRMDATGLFQRGASLGQVVQALHSF